MLVLGTPGPQRFAVEDLGDYDNILASGDTQPWRVTVPEPASLLLLLPGLAALIVRKRPNRAA
jgi:hypothetical protein